MARRRTGLFTENDAGPMPPPGENFYLWPDMVGRGNVWDQWTFNCASDCWLNRTVECNNNCLDFDVAGHRDLRFMRGDSRDVYASSKFNLFQLPLSRDRFAVPTMIHVLSDRIFDPAAAKATVDHILR